MANIGIEALINRLDNLSLKQNPSSKGSRESAQPLFTVGFGVAAIYNYYKLGLPQRPEPSEFSFVGPAVDLSR